MPSLKDLRNRISSVKSTKKITSAMKMVAAAKLKRAQVNAEKTRPYARKMSEIVNSLVENNKAKEFKYSEKKTKKTKNILLIVCSADRGLCGGFNGSIVKFSKKLSEKIINSGDQVSYIFVGKKAYQSLQRYCGEYILEFFSDIANPTIKFDLAKSIRDKVLELFLKNSMDECHLIYTEFRSAISQTVQSLQLLPLNASDTNIENNSNRSYDFEPSEEEILNEIIPKNIAIQIHTALLENLASEQGSRMTAMDNATRNANDMIDNLTLFYNRSRQALITKELIEIISGAEAV
tara:strand:- start:1048 stop:1923 length:876 start_codon:yes stop_codon:yes gene_type:complete